MVSSEESENDTDVSERDFVPESKNGVYLLSVKSIYDGYLVKGKGDKVMVPDVTINGRYIGTSDYFETECDGFEITEDGVLNLRYNDMENKQEGDDG